MKPVRILVLAVAAVAAVGLAVVVRGALSGKATSEAVAEPVRAPAPPPKPMAKVLVAARDLKIGDRLTPQDMTWQDWPLEAVNPAFVTDGAATPARTAAAAGPVKAETSKPTGEAKATEAAAADSIARESGEKAVTAVTRAVTDLADGGPKAQFAGAVVREPMLKGEPMVERKLVRAGQSGYLAVVLPPGMRAMAVPVKVETAAGGFILPGDRVDVLLSRQVQTADSRTVFASSTVLQNIKVLAVDQVTQPAKDASSVVGATATLEVGAREAEALALAKAEGDLSLVLRSYADVGEPSGKTAGGAPAQATVTASRAVRVFRNGQSSEVTVN